MRRLIINADDLGISFEVDEQIEKYIQEGVVTSSTLMANAPAFDDGVRIAKQYPQISVGAHLNLIEFAPLTNPDVFKKYGVVGEDGNFIEGAISCVQINNELKQAVFEEWDAQIKKIIDAGIIPTHCDSHQHTHTLFALRDPLCQILKKHNINKVRRKLAPSIFQMLRERRHPTIRINNSKVAKIKKQNVFTRRLHFFAVIRACRKWNRLMGKQFNITDGFFHFNTFFYDHNALHIWGNNSVVELMCHPGHPAYQNESDNLMRNRTWLISDYELITYRDFD